MIRTDRAEKISITLPPDMLADIKEKVEAGDYASTSEVVREAMRLWQKHEEEHKARIDLIRERLERSVHSGKPIPIDQAFGQIERLHKRRKKQAGHEKI